MVNDSVAIAAEEFYLFQVSLGDGLRGTREITVHLGEKSCWIGAKGIQMSNFRLIDCEMVCYGWFINCWDLFEWRS